MGYQNHCINWKECRIISFSSNTMVEMEWKSLFPPHWFRARIEKRNSNTRVFFMTLLMHVNTEISNPRSMIRGETFSMSRKMEMLDIDSNNDTVKHVKHGFECWKTHRKYTEFFHGIFWHTFIWWFSQSVMIGESITEIEFWNWIDLIIHHNA